MAAVKAPSNQNTNLMTEGSIVKNLLLFALPLGVTGIWLSVPIGWALADAIGIGYYLKKRR